MEEPTNNCVCGRVESFFSLTFLADWSVFQRAGEEGSPVLAPRMLTVLGELVFYSLNLWGWPRAWLALNGLAFLRDAFSQVHELWSCLYSLPWKLRQKRTLATLPLSKCWKLGFVTSWLWTKLPLLLHMWDVFLLAKASKEKSVYFVSFPPFPLPPPSTLTLPPPFHFILWACCGPLGSYFKYQAAQVPPVICFYLLAGQRPREALLRQRNGGQSVNFVPRPCLGDRTSLLRKGWAGLHFVMPRLPSQQWDCPDVRLHQKLLRLDVKRGLADLVGRLCLNTRKGT